MAYLPDDEEKDPNAPVPGLAPSTNPSTPQAQATGASVDPGGSGFINFDRILEANKPAADKLATQVDSDAASSAGKQSTAVSGAVSKFQGDSNAGTLYAQPGTNPAQDQAAAATNSMYAGATPGAKGSATYAGPNDLTDEGGYADLAQNQQDTSAKLHALDSENGLQSYLQKLNVGGGNYTQGESQFDAALAGHAQAGNGTYSALHNVWGDKFQGFDGMLDNANTAAGKYADANRATTDANSALWRNYQPPAPVTAQGPHSNPEYGPSDGRDINNGYNPNGGGTSGDAPGAGGNYFSDSQRRNGENGMGPDGKPIAPYTGKRTTGPVDPNYQAPRWVDGPSGGYWENSPGAMYGYDDLFP